MTTPDLRFYVPALHPSAGELRSTEDVAEWLEADPLNRQIALWTLRQIEARSLDIALRPPHLVDCITRNLCQRLHLPTDCKDADLLALEVGFGLAAAELERARGWCATGHTYPAIHWSLASVNGQGPDPVDVLARETGYAAPSTRRRGWPTGQ